jgi:hypothetical protein
VVRPLEQLCPLSRLPTSFSFGRNKQVTLQKVKQAQNINALFNLPLSAEAFDQLIPQAQLIDNIQGEEEDDIWVYIWGSPFFSSVKAYNQLLGFRFVHPCHSWLWKATAQKKLKVFFW